MQSERLLNADTSPLGEGLKQHNMSDGVTYFYRSGEEYFDIAPVYDFSRWNGITVDYPATYPKVPNYDYWPSRGLSDFAGGVSDGQYGVSTMWFKRRLLHGKKSWFFHDEGMIALGADISLYKEQNTKTSINQEWSKGNLIYGLKKDSDELELAEGNIEVNEPAWVWAQGMGYDLIAPNRFVIQNKEQTGNWKSIADFLSEETIKGKVTSLWIEHGLNYSDYAYAVYPEISKDDFRQRLKNPKFKILSNTGKIQAVSFENNILQIIFHSPGKLSTEVLDNLSIEVDKPVAVMIKKNKSGLSLSTSAPNQKIGRAHFKIGQKGKKVKIIKIQYPDEMLAGSTVKRSI
jgi:chondroitin AC lyase